MKNIFVGNLSFGTSEEAVRSLFEAHGTVDRVKIVRDRDTGQPRGFGFVEMTNDKEGTAAINALNGRDLDGRTLNVNEARPKTERGFAGGGGGGGRTQRWEVDSRLKTRAVFAGAPPFLLTASVRNLHRIRGLPNNYCGWRFLPFGQCGRPTEQETLNLIAVHVLQEFQLFLSLDSL